MSKENTKPNAKVEEVVLTEKSSRKMKTPGETQFSFFQKISVSKYLLDAAFIALAFPALTYLLAFFYKRGKYKYFGISTDYVEITYSDLTPTWFALILILAIAIPLHPFFVTIHESEKISNIALNKTFFERLYAGAGKNFLLLAVTISLIICSVFLYPGLRVFPEFALRNIFLVLLLLISILLTYSGLTIRGDETFQKAALKVFFLIFGFTSFLLILTFTFHRAGQFMSEKRRNFSTVCSDENLVMIGKVGERIIAKEINRETLTFGNGFFLIGKNCVDEKIRLEEKNIGTLKPQSK